MKYRILSIAIVFLTIVSMNADSFIVREYSLQEIINESSNVVFGKVTDVNSKRMTAKVLPIGDLKGKTQFREIKINIAVGQGNFPQELIRKFKKGLPIAIFYKDDGAQLSSVAHLDGTWFQLFAPKHSDLNRTWWNFTHIEIYMHRTFKGSTPDLQNKVRQMLGKKPVQIREKPKFDFSDKNAISVLVLTDNNFSAEFPVISSFSEIKNKKFAFRKTKDRNLPGIEKSDLLWIGSSEIASNGYRLNKQHENKIKTFVKMGGIVIVSGQDSDDGKPCGIGWITAKIKGVERMGRSDFKPTSAAGKLFDQPNKIRSGEVFIDDSWINWDKNFTVLATTNGGKEIAVALLKHGKGAYLITSFQNETNANVFVNQPMIENLLLFAAELAGK